MEAHPLVKIDSLRDGESDGAGTVLRITPVVGPTFHAVAVPQDWYSYTGPTWVYVIDGDDGLILIDSASGLVVERMEEAFRLIGMNRASVERVIISHGHLDHDGGALLLARQWGVEVWAHVLWDSLRYHDRMDSLGSGWDLIRQELEADLASDEPLGHGGMNEQRRARLEKYANFRQDLNITRLVDEGDSAQGLVFHHTPGHSPDELTVEKGAVLFAGDHILPEITPHPTIKTQLPASIRARIPAMHRDLDRLFGLDVYLRSVKMVAAMPEETLVMPAHRLVNRGKLHVLTVARAAEILDHHIERLEHILTDMQTRSWGLGELTKSLFKHRSLQNVYEAALHETMSHLELLLASGDVVESPDHRFSAVGTQNYVDMLRRPLAA